MRRIGRWILVILILEFVLAFLLGLHLQGVFEEPRFYLGSSLAPRPLHVADASALVLGAGQGEEQVG